MYCTGATGADGHYRQTFKVPAAYHNTAVFQIGVNKIPPKFDTLFATYLEVVWLFKGLTAQHL